MLQEFGLIYGGPQDILRLENKSIDLFINVASFQEMTQDQVNRYFEIIDIKVSGFLFVQQYWEHPGLHKQFGTISGINEYRFYPKWNKKYIRNAIFSERYFEALYKM